MNRNQTAGSRWLGVAAFFVFAGGVAMAAIFYLVREPDWQSDPTAVRPDAQAEWHRKTTPAGPAPPVDLTLLDRIVMESDERAVRVVSEIPHTALSNEPTSYTVARVRPGEATPVDLPELRAIGVGYVKEPGSPKFDFYSPDGLPIAGEEERNLRMTGGADTMAGRVDLQLHFDLPPGGGSFLGSEVVDGRTCWNVRFGGYSTSHRRDRVVVSLDLGKWHPGPLFVAADFALGEPLLFEAPARPGETITFPGGAVRLLGWEENFDPSRSSSRGEGARSIWIAERIEGEEGPHIPSEEEATLFVFAALPRATSAPFEIELLDAEGRELQAHGSGASGAVARIRLLDPPEKFARFRVKLRPDVRRIVYELPNLPGLPPENRGVRNLFDVTIPTAQVAHAYGFDELLKSSLQMEVRILPGAHSTPFAMAGSSTYTGTTPRELLRDYVRAINPDAVARVDSANFIVEIVGPDRQTWGETLVRYLGR